MTPRFTTEDRDRVRERVFEIARADDRITGGAVTGSRAVGREDRWSDVDTAFGFRPGTSAEAILDDWTEELDREFDVVHRFDLTRGASRYRVFLLANGLELDVSLTEAGEFGAHGPTFQLVFGDAHDRQTAAESPDQLIGWGWIFALYTRAAIARGSLWQAEYTINGIRDNGLALACLRFGLPTDHRRGVDRLPSEATEPWEEGRVHSLKPIELRRALSAASASFVEEVAHVDARLAADLRGLLPIDG
jgi:hypothetical protein